MKLSHIICSFFPSYDERFSRTLPLMILLAAVSLPFSASALLMTEYGPERIMVQVKESLRKSDDLNQELINLALLEQREGMTVEKRWVGEKYLELLSFPPTMTEDQALAVIARFQQWPSVEKVVAVSAFNLEFTSGDFEREFAQTDLIPEAARRGLDNAYYSVPLLLPTPPDLSVPHLPTQFIVTWKDEYVWKAEETGFNAKMAAFNAVAGTAVLYDLYRSSHELTQVLSFDPALATLADELNRYNASPWVAYAVPDYLYSTQLIPNDPGYTNPGQPNLSIVKAPSGTGAWNETTGTQSLRVAVADTGANVNHPDFAPNLSAGSRNFISNNSNVTDDHGHGSNVAAIIGAKGNNNQYMTGVDWNVSLLHLKVLNAAGSGSSSTIAAGIDYAATSFPSIAINLSLGTPPSSSIDLTMRDAIRRARARNMVVVAAAGNNGRDAEQAGNLVSPASIPAQNVIAVGATNDNDTRAGFSNFGRYRVELGAPGVQILGLTQALGFYSRFDGTSQATPHVTGALELIKSKYPWENYAGLKDRVLMGVDDIASLNNVFRTGGRLNLKKALQPRRVIRNLSTRGKVESGNRIIIGGFIIGGSGTGTLKIALRGLGPSLPPLGVARLNDPKIQLYNSAGQPIPGAFNNDWGTLPQTEKNDLAAAGLTPTNAREAALVRTLAPGAYTLFVQSQDGLPGVGLFEIFELEGGADEQTRLQNISTRCPVGVGDEVAIAGTIIGNSSNPSDNTVPKRRLLIRGLGPTLASFGVPGVLANPKISLRNSAGGEIGLNDQWRDVDGASTGLEAKLTESAFAPTCTQCNNESILWPTLRQSSYTNILSGVNGTGIGLVEFFEF